jgi:hypothetical protein
MSEVTLKLTSIKHNEQVVPMLLPLPSYSGYHVSLKCTLGYIKDNDGFNVSATRLLSQVDWYWRTENPNVVVYGDAELIGKREPTADISDLESYLETCLR